MQPGYRDQLSVDTPEQVALDLPLAGLGSRCLAHLLDVAIQYIVLLFLIFVIFAVFAASSGLASRADHMSETEQKWVFAGLVLLVSAYFAGYFALFEAFWRGQTPGKRVLKIRVIKDSGRGLTFFEAMARNVLRIVDALPGFYALGVVTMLISRRSQRLGDMVAGTLVVHQQPTDIPALDQRNRTFTASLSPVTSPSATPAALSFGIEFPADRIRLLTAEDLLVLESFFARAHELDYVTTERLATQMLTGLCGRMGVTMPPASHRRALESIAKDLRAAITYR